MRIRPQSRPKEHDERVLAVRRLGTAKRPFVPGRRPAVARAGARRPVFLAEIDQEQYERDDDDGQVFKQMHRIIHRISVTAQYVVATGLHVDFLKKRDLRRIPWTAERACRVPTHARGPAVVVISTAGRCPRYPPLQTSLVCYRPEYICARTITGRLIQFDDKIK